MSDREYYAHIDTNHTYTAKSWPFVQLFTTEGRQEIQKLFDTYFNSLSGNSQHDEKFRKCLITNAIEEEIPC